jgi:hypothetical protein
MDHQSTLMSYRQFVAALKATQMAPGQKRLRRGAWTPKKARSIKGKSR